MNKPLVFAGLSLLAAGCAATPQVTRETMTLGEAGIEGMECRRETIIGSSFKRTICASPETWARYDAQKRQEAERYMDSPRQQSNVNKFGRAQ
ncbi:MAG: hypothetical protein KGS00_06710 [Alphaproteobacteria bacterium]|nr:hypothetical protein [Alphaproteobacteria bacterium]